MMYYMLTKELTLTTVLFLSFHLRVYVSYVHSLSTTIAPTPSLHVVSCYRTNLLLNHR